MLNPSLISRGEARHALTRKVFHGHSGDLRQPQREGQEDHFGAVGLVINAIALWNTRYMAVALDYLRANEGRGRTSNVSHPYATAT